MEKPGYDAGLFDSNPAHFTLQLLPGGQKGDTSYKVMLLIYQLNFLMLF